MSSDLYSLGTNFHTHSTSDGVGDLPFFSDPFPFFNTSSSHTTDVAQQSSNPFDESLPFSLDPFPPSFFSFSPPSSHLESLNLYQGNNHTTTVQTLSSNGPTNSAASELGSFSAFDGSEVKSEESQMGLDYAYNNQQFLPHSYSGTESVSKYMQRSFSSNSFEGKPGFLFQTRHETLVDSPNFQRNDISSPENSAFSGQMRRVCSTGDLQVKNNINTLIQLWFILCYYPFFVFYSSVILLKFVLLPEQNMKANHMSSTEGQLLEEPNFKVGRYSAEERKERISKYRAKRTQRNFNKTIKVINKKMALMTHCFFCTNNWRGRVVDYY